MKKGIVLLSGGLDSAVTAAIAKKEMDEIYCLTFDYGQAHRKEIHSAERIAHHFKVKEHRVLELDLEQITESGLLGQEEIPEEEDAQAVLGRGSIPSTYVPARNIIFLSIALSYAERTKAETIYLGANSVDFSGYPDCRPEFFQKFQEMTEVGTKSGVEGNPIEIRTPILEKSKAQIIEKGKELEVPFGFTWSCYRGKGRPCGRCDSCLLRLKGFEEAGMQDPLEYDSQKP